MAAPKSARAVALDVLSVWRKGKRTAAELLDKRLCESDRPAMTTDLVYGVIRNLTLLDCVLETVAHIKLRHTQPNLVTLLRIGAWELIFSTEAAEYAIINEAAELAGKHPKQRGFVNAVLRSVQRAVEYRSAPSATFEPPRVIPLTETTGCIFDRPILPDPQEDEADYFSTLFSIPGWLIRLWLDAYDTETTRQICLGSNRSPGVIVQPNTLKTTAARLRDALEAEAAHPQLFPERNCLRIQTHRSLTELWSFQQGLFLVQDPTAAMAAEVLAPPPGSTAIDLCAAPGGKTAGLAMQMNNQGRILASDISPQRLERVAENAKRLGIGIIECMPLDEIKKALGSRNKVHSVLLDGPCSNTGVLARRVEVRHRLTPRAVAEIAAIQDELLETAAPFVRKHGHLLYSTCSILPEENDSRVQHFLGNHPEFRLVKSILTLPAAGSPETLDHDGGFLALLKKE
jgi:16S rRNA (cytosine967-C5)-methyltransferase